MENVATEEFISREAALFALRKAERGGSMTALTRLERAYAEIREMPAADVVEVVHGRWLEEKGQTLLPVEYDDVGEPILHDYVVYRCDRCGRTCKQKEPYCHCGAKMEDGVNE